MKIYLDSIGCRLNQAEIERYARQFVAAGHSLVDTPHEADMAVVNTCTVTTAADSDSRKKIRRAVRAGVGELIATGCWVTLNPDEARAMKGVSQVVLNFKKDELVADRLQIAPHTFDLEPLEREIVPGARFRTRAFIKAQDGCENRCTFCITSLARGVSASRTVEEVLIDIRSAVGMDGENGKVTTAAQEIVLTGVHLGSWGQDFAKPQHLEYLVRRILEDTDVPRIRLSSIEPWDLNTDFFALWENERLCRHLHLPLQSGSAATLRRMARKTTPDKYAELVKFAKDAVPGAAITTDIITGFPGESDREFEESLEFVRQMNFAGGHVFTYSDRPGTAAAAMPDQVPYPVRKERNARMREVLSVSAQHYKDHFIGEVLSVLWESAAAVGPEGWQVSGLTDNYLRVKVIADQHLWNTITDVRLKKVVNGAIQGEPI